MSTVRERPSGQPPQTHAAQSEMEATELNTPRKPTFTENVIMTIKVLGVFALIGAALWAINLWTAPN
jgi:hypothetical protein